MITCILIQKKLYSYIRIQDILTIAEDYQALLQKTLWNNFVILHDVNCIREQFYRENDKQQITKLSWLVNMSWCVFS